MLPLTNQEQFRRWFAGLVESNFQSEIGSCDPELLNYLTDLLTEFVHVERINLLHDGSGRPVEAVAEMLVQADRSLLTDEQRQREVHRHIGDFTLFWTGIYPENLHRLSRRRKPDALLDYFKQGKRSYAIASELSTQQMKPPADVLQLLSNNFECCVYGLGLVRKDWEQGEGIDSSLS